MKKFKLRFMLKPYFWVPALLFIFVCSCFLVWFLLPKKSLTVAVLDKTVPATAADNYAYEGDVYNNYRKHIGLYWLLDYLKVKNPATGKLYNYQTDYYGPTIDKNARITGATSLTDMDEIPDILYLADTYGVEVRDDHGLTQDEMNTVSLCHDAGSVVIGEQDILTTATSGPVKAQLEELFGIRTTGWVGRYVNELADLTDVPYWAPPMYEQKYGQEWKLAGPGILLVSSEGDIIVLEEKTDFMSSDLLKISVTEKYRSEFGKRSMNFYNWFELIEADYDTEVFATYSFHVNSTGAEKLAAVSHTTTFAAATRNRTEDRADAYYFAGDFNDYTAALQIHCFCFADSLFRMFSFDREGDVSNFYWNFFEPVMKKIVRDVQASPLVHESPATGQISRVEGEQLQLLTDGEWNDFSVRGFNLNAELPGNERYNYSRDYSVYLSLLKSLKSMGGNCVRTYDLLPPEFYRALYEVNRDTDEKMYLIQGVLTSTEGDPAEILSSLPQAYTRLDSAVKAVHGGSTENGVSYSYDVSAYCIAYLIDPRIDSAASDRLMAEDFTFSGQYLSSSRNSVEALAAALGDHLLTEHQALYGYCIPVSVCFPADRLEGASWAQESSLVYNPSALTLSEAGTGLYYTALSLNTDDPALLNNSFSYQDTAGDLPYGGYIREAKSLCSGAVLIDRVGLSTNTNLFESVTSINGLSEKEQGNGLIRLLQAARNEGYFGALIADLNDNWSALSADMEPWTVPSGNNALWQNTADRAQTSGIIAVDSVVPREIAMELNDSGEMQQMQLSYNETYVYVTILLKNEIDYDARQLILGIDTYQRNNGEYYYDKGYFANSLSGMEYIVKFESKSSASLYVIKSYDRTAGGYVSQESYSADYDLVCVLNHGDFASSNTHFYQTGMTIRIRIPWAMLNFTDPSNHLVLNGFSDGKAQTSATEGMIFSLLIGDKTTMDTAYIFPESKHQAGYKTLKLSGWNSKEISYTLREKASASILKRYFASLNA